MTNDETDMRSVVNSIKEIDDKLKEENSDEKRTRLMYEQMLRGLKLTNNPMQF